MASFTFSSFLHKAFQGFPFVLSSLLLQLPEFLLQTSTEGLSDSFPGAA
jgi:hypothetical protein